MKQLLKALDAGFTAFCNELWLPTFGFHLFDDPADALEDAPEYNGQAMWRLGDVPVERAGSLSAPGDGPEVGDFPRSASTSGQPLINGARIRAAADGLRELVNMTSRFPDERVWWEQLASDLDEFSEQLDAHK